MVAGFGGHPFPDLFLDKAASIGCVKNLKNLQSLLDNSSCVNSQVGKGAVVRFKVR